MASTAMTVNSGVTTWIKSAEEFAGEKLLIDSQYTYDVTHCGDYALYYLNLRGGWDPFLIEGKVKRSDNYTRSEYLRKQEYTSRSMVKFGRTVYMTETEPTWELHTGWLTDAQAEILVRNLLSSPRVYLHNLKDNTICTVVITNSNAEYKTHKNEKKLVAYTINVAASNKEIRR